MRFSAYRSAATQAAVVPRARGATFLALACMTVASCASVSPYNPDHLSAHEVSRVGEVCQGVMGLQPSKVLTENLWPGDPDPALETNDYRGCIATLSNSLEAATASKGPRLTSLDMMPPVEQATTPSPDQASASLPREQQACAQIGLDPSQRAFENCVEGLRNVMSAGSMADSYRN